MGMPWVRGTARTSLAEPPLPYGHTDREVAGYHGTVVFGPYAPPMHQVRIECRKWPDDRHWEFDAVRLGADQHGIWCGVARGTLMASATRSLTAAADHVTLVPYDEWYLATFYGDDSQRPCDVYVDIATPAVWHDGESRLRAVDLDLDVIRGTTGRVWVDDEDEFAEHRVSLGYPADVVSGAMASCDRVHAAVRDGEPPFDPATSQEWLARFRRRRG